MPCLSFTSSLFHIVSLLLLSSIVSLFRAVSLSLLSIVVSLSSWRCRRMPCLSFLSSLCLCFLSVESLFRVFTFDCRVSHSFMRTFLDVMPSLTHIPFHHATCTHTLPCPRSRTYLNAAPLVDTHQMDPDNPSVPNFREAMLSGCTGVFRLSESLVYSTT